MVVAKTKAPFLQSRSSQRLRRQEAMMRDTHYDGGPTDEQMLTIVAPWEISHHCHGCSLASGFFDAMRV